MKTIHMICNAHIDPVWLWNWQEGAAAAISTFRCAADFCDEFDGFVFNHNESLLYKWVEEHEPQLFDRIKAHVKVGKWKIMGGWYNQPDCNMPSGESFTRQILYGKNYFLEKFGVEPQTALNFDSFGHTRGLVQILKKSGYKSYMVSKILEQGDHRWVGFDGSEIIAHRTFEYYGSTYGDLKNKIMRFVDHHGGKMPEHTLLAWGVGDHGGGPSRRDIADIAMSAKDLEPQGIQLLHSTPDDYFNTVDIKSLPAMEVPIRPCEVGGYTTMSRIKKSHRRLENTIYMTEKMLAHANLVYGTPYDKDAIEQATEDLMFCQFHDILPGTMVEEGEMDSLNRMSRGITAMENLQAKAFFALSAGEPKGKEDEIPILVYNPHPYPVHAQISCEYQLANQNWNYGQFTAGEVYHNGEKVLSQFEKEASSLNLDWRKRVVFDAELEPLTMNRFDCKLKVIERRNWDISGFEPRYFIDNGEMQIRFNPETGLIDSYCVDGKVLLTEGSAKLLVIQDDEDPWAMRVDSFQNIVGEFKLLSPEAAAEFLGYPERPIAPFKIAEDGDVRTIFEGLYGYNRSYAVVQFGVPKRGKNITIDVTLHMADANKMVKLSFNTIQGQFSGQTAFGTEDLPMEGKAAVFQKFSAVQNGESAFVVVNDGTYSGDYENGTFNQVLLRTAGYAAHPLAITRTIDNANLTPDEKATNMREIIPKSRYMQRIDMGVRKFSFSFYGDRDIRLADYYAAVFNGKPFALSFFPSGDGEKCGNFITIDNKAVTMSAFKKAYDGNGYIVRLYNSSNQEETVTVDITPLQMQQTLTFGKYEVKTFRINVENTTFTETDLLERKELL